MSRYRHVSAMKAQGFLSKRPAKRPSSTSA